MLEYFGFNNYRLPGIGYMPLILVFVKQRSSVTYVRTSRSSRSTQWDYSKITVWHVTLTFIKTFIKKFIIIEFWFRLWQNFQQSEMAMLNYIFIPSNVLIIDDYQVELGGEEAQMFTKQIHNCEYVSARMTTARCSNTSRHTVRVQL